MPLSMPLGGLILLTSCAYLGVLFAIAYWGDKRADAGRSIIANPYIYALSMAVYATSWTFYGSVGRAAVSGVGFLPIYLGPTLMAALFWLVLRKMIRISKANRITSIADFIAARYGKSALLGGLVTLIAVVGVIPYIALQLKAVSSSFLIFWQYPAIQMPNQGEAMSPLQDTALYVALLLALFTIVFGTRHLDATERHEGMVAAIAFESLVKLLAFLAVGIFVTFVLYDGFADIFDRAAELPNIDQLLTLGGPAGTYGSWAALIFLSMLSILFLPRQFQISVVENVNENHLAKAIWLFPLYLLAINIFVLPIAFAGLMHFSAGTVDADTFVLTLPMAHGPSPGGPGAAGLRWWLVRRHRHDHRRNHRALYHDLQRSGHAIAAAMENAGAGPAPGLVAAAAGHPPWRHSVADAARLRVLPGCRRSLRAGFHRLGVLRCSGPVRPGDARGDVLEAGDSGWRPVGPVSGFSAMDLHPAAASVCQVRLAAAELYRAGTVRHRLAQTNGAVWSGWR
ncbi:hypothetical protein [uncultured Marinobacter sp.]|uniref:hypothetical protein n=1 Tax=uncultured Marinobacter sp. TaxID=187379 RepID=UPI00261435E2|nr:hypothetical protein [uncultured Marinobacter sp.]